MMFYVDTDTSLITRYKYLSQAPARGDNYVLHSLIHNCLVPHAEDETIGR
jgi:hypothetical protein